MAAWVDRGKTDQCARQCVARANRASSEGMEDYVGEKQQAGKARGVNETPGGEVLV